MDIGNKIASQLLGTVLFIVSLSTALPAAAAERDGESSERVRLYLGGSTGLSKMKNGNSVFTGAQTQDTNDIGYKAFLGLEFVPHGAMEISVIDFGEFSALDSGFPLYAPTYETQGVNIGFVGGGDLNSFISAHIKLGLFAWRVKVGGTNTAGVPLSLEETGVDFSWGLGTQFNMGRFVALRLEYEQFGGVGEQATTGQTDLQLISASLLFRL
jgi:opacity protein-like surface antigen